MIEQRKEHEAKIRELLSHYEEGDQIFINAFKADTWQYPVTIKEESKNIPDLPQDWISLVDRVIGIIARDKYDLDCYPNEIQIITASQMLDAYTSIGLPISPPHWSNGMRRLDEQRKYDQNKSLAFEIVINSDPAIAYCMQNNSPVMQALVIAHASYGHNAFFKNNYMFKGHSNAATIIDDTIYLRRLILEAEKKHGYEAVTQIMDLCGALRGMDISRAIPVYNTKTEAEKRALTKERADERFFTQKRKGFGVDTATTDFDDAADPNKPPADYKHMGMDNVLLFMANNAPHLPEWAREIMRMRSKIEQYFWPQMHTKVLNEGFASYVHHLILTDLHKMGLFSDGMYLEFMRSHGSVLYQPEFDEKVKVKAKDGTIKEVGIYNGINPYALGFAILDDIRRICTNPTEEDKKWFPHLAGQPDWWARVKEAAFNYRDDRGIRQYLSPKVMRDFKFFSVEDSEEKEFVDVRAIHDKEGFERVRWTLGEQYTIADKFPDIRVHNVQERTDRCLILRHISIDGKQLYKPAAVEILKHIHQAWGHPVALETVDAEGKVTGKLTSPRNYDYMAFSTAKKHAEYGAK